MQDIILRWYGVIIIVSSMKSFIRGAKRFFKHIVSFWNKNCYPNIATTARVDETVVVRKQDNLIMDENTNIDAGAYIMNGRAKLVFKKNSGAAVGLLAITGNHMSIVGKNLKQITDKTKDEFDVNHEMDKDIVVEEDVWIAARVTLLSGSRLGRGCEVGAGSVVRGNIPPYSVVIGNPCKVVGFRFTPEEIIEHEKVQYEEPERLPFELLQKNYEKYFLNRIKDIKQFTKL